MDEKLIEKRAALVDFFARQESVAVAFSSGVDSTLVLAVAHEVLGPRAVAFTATSPMYPERETQEAKRFCSERGIEQVLFEAHELEIEGFSHNPANRCYLCKTSLFGEVAQLARERGISCVVEGSNADDAGDYRPGAQAVRELGIESPLALAGLTKDEIRALSKDMGLPTWNKQSFACLASRFAYGDEITLERLAKVDAAEQVLLDLGFTQVRVRIHDTIARIEMPPSQFGHIMDDAVRAQVVDALKGIGFTYVALDLQGYRTGAMNETL